MTDDKIIKSLKWLVFNFPKIENPEDDADKMCNCINLYCQNAIDLINHQEAEIERYEIRIRDLNNYQTADAETRKRVIAKAKSEAIKEFAEKLTEKAYINDYYEMVVHIAAIDSLVKEMTENDFKG